MLTRMCVRVCVACHVGRVSCRMEIDPESKNWHHTMTHLQNKIKRASQGNSKKVQPAIYHTEMAPRCVKCIFFEPCHTIFWDNFTKTGSGHT